MVATIELGGLVQHGIMMEGEQGETIIVVIPESFPWAKVQDQRDVLEDLGYDTRGIGEVITLAEAKKRARK